MYLLRIFQQCMVVLALTIPGKVCADIYVYEDARGVKHYTNAPTSNRYRLAALRRLNTPPGTSSYSKHMGSRRKNSASNDSTRFDQQIEKAAKVHMLDPLLIKAIIKAESDFDQYATSPKGARGLMQLMPGTARDLRVGNPFNAAQNINGGTRYFKKLFDSYGGDLVRSLAAYNAGPGRVTKNGPLPMLKETREYVQKVTRYYQMYQQAMPLGVSQKGKLGRLATVN